MLLASQINRYFLPGRLLINQINRYITNHSNMNRCHNQQQTQRVIAREAITGLEKQSDGHTQYGVTSLSIICYVLWGKPKVHSCINIRESLSQHSLVT